MPGQMVNTMQPTQPATIWPAWNLQYGNCTTVNTANTWVPWNGQYELVTGTAASTTLIWTQWVTTTTATPAGFQLTNAWQDWNRQYQPYIVNAPIWQAREPTPAEMRRLEAERKRREREARRRLREYEMGRKRARRLLLSVLEPEQRKDYEEKGRFHLLTRDGRRYRVDQGTHGNVKLVDEADRIVSSFCIQPPGVPEEDAMAAQVLMLKTDEASFRRIANERRWA